MDPAVWTVVVVLSGLVAWAAAGFVLYSAPDRRVAWRFGVLLALEGVMILSTRSGLIGLTSDPELRLLLWQIHVANDALLVACYLPALAVTIPSRLLAPFARRDVAVGMALVGCLAAAVVFSGSELFIRNTDVLVGEERFGSSVGPAWSMVFGLLVVNYSIGLVTAALAWKRAPTELARKRAGALTLAFGTRDLVWGFGFGLGFLSQIAGRALLHVNVVEPASIALIVYVSLTAYGIASSNLFDIDLKVKWTLTRGTLAGIFIAAFFVVSEGAASLLSDQLGNVLGLLVTGGLVFALSPLQRAAERLADTAMPSVQDTDEYRTFRKLQVYGEAVSEAMAAGEISPVQRAALKRLRERLELSAEDADAFETEFEPATCVTPPGRP